MKWIIWLLNKLGLGKISLGGPHYRTKIVQDVLPLRLIRSALYVVEDDGYKEQVAMLCPCGCGLTLHMNLIPDERPCWHLTIHQDGSASLDPSVWRKKDCKSHFWIRNGRVHWCHGRENWLAKQLSRFFHL